MRKYHWYWTEEESNNKEIVMNEIKRDGRALGHASAALQSDREFVLEAVKQSGIALEFVSEHLKSDREVVLAAIKKDGIAIVYASEELQHDEEMKSEAVRLDPYALILAGIGDGLKLTKGQWYAAKRDFQLHAINDYGDWATDENGEYIYTVTKKGEKFELIDFGWEGAMAENNEGEWVQMSVEAFKEMFEEVDKHE